MDEICNQLGLPKFLVSRGSTEPRDFLVAVAEQLGIVGGYPYLDKSSLGRRIVEAGGRTWLPSYDSSGGTVTKDGLTAILETVQRLVR